MKNFLHHLEYEESGLGVEDVKKVIAEKKVFYDHSADKRERKWNNSTKLVKEDISLLPEYVKNNREKFNDWLDEI